MIHVMGSHDESRGFRYWFHYYHFVPEGMKITRPELLELTPNHYEAELLAYDYKEYRNGLRDMVGNRFKNMPSCS